MKSFSPAFLDALARDKLGIALLATFDFGADGIYRFWDGRRPIRISDGRAFVGAAAFADYEGGGGAGNGLAAIPRRIVLDGARWARAAEQEAAEAGGAPIDPAAALRSIADMAYRNAPVTLELLLTDLDTRAEIGVERLDQVSIDRPTWKREPARGAQIGKLTLHCETRGRFYSKGTGRTFTHQDQLELTDGADTFFEYQVTSLERERRHKGGDSVSTGGGSGAGGGRQPYFNPHFDGTYNRLNSR